MSQRQSEEQGDGICLVVMLHLAHGRHDPAVRPLFVHRDLRSRHVLTGERATGYGDEAGQLLGLPIDRGAARRAEVERIAGLPLSGGRLTRATPMLQCRKSDSSQVTKPTEHSHGALLPARGLG